MSKPTIYFAHPVWTYGTAVEAAIVKALSKDYEVVNPNAPEHQAAYALEGMAYFTDLVLGCEALCYLPEYEDEWDGDKVSAPSVGAGVAREILEALVNGQHVYRLWDLGHVYRLWDLGPGRVWLLHRAVMPDRILTIDETRRRRAEKLDERKLLADRAEFLGTIDLLALAREVDGLTPARKAALLTDRFGYNDAPLVNVAMLRAREAA